MRAHLLKLKTFSSIKYKNKTNKLFLCNIYFRVLGIHFLQVHTNVGCVQPGYQPYVFRCPPDVTTSWGSSSEQVSNDGQQQGRLEGPMSDVYRGAGAMYNDFTD